MNAMFKVVCFSILFCKIDSILIVYCGENNNVRFDGVGATRRKRPRVLEEECNLRRFLYILI